MPASPGGAMVKLRDTSTNGIGLKAGLCALRFVGGGVGGGRFAILLSDIEVAISSD